MNRVITVFWFEGHTIEVFSSLKPVLLKYKSLDRQQVEYCLSRKKTPYEDKHIRIERKTVIK